ncbi:hypothetical protein NUW58_g6936 [Xylaria curta]|uniref:Uncharacterized protein n=1 Tax=Xylaria curta TaxID=42375 RepID=A0ACC1NMB4_9PEZI|nr:hypothetical protein NUW58_g6936 [Xylaria curta]
MTQLTAAGSMAELDKWDRTRDEFSSQRQMPLSIEREVAVLKLIDHPHIVKLHDIWENRAEIYLVMEYMDGGDMFSYINTYGPLPEFEMVGYFRQILTALEYVHSFNICHRDLKPENILMKSNGVVKIADFGMAAIQQSPTHALRTSCGSPHYAAPELIARSRYQGDKVDIWSMGCLLYATLCRRLPFDDPEGNVPKLLAKARKGVYFVPDFLSREARDLIARMLTVDPLKRIPIRKIWQHPMIRKYDDLDDLNDSARVLNSRASDRSKPVPPEELDLQILRQLKSMWHTFSEKQIAMQLSNTQPNDQKLFYWLLISYREMKLENYETDLAYSPSDYHHLRPANWKKKFTTAEFPSRYGRTPSRFTVISTVPTNGSIEEADNVTDGGATIVSYDPYKSSRIMGNVYASHSKIVVHRNGSTANNSSRSSNSRHGRSGSFRSNSTLSRPARGGRRITAPAAMRASRHSLSSIQSGESTLYTRPASRRKRGVNFSHVRMQSEVQREVTHGPASMSEDDATYKGHTSSVNSTKDTRSSRNLNGRNKTGTQSTANTCEEDQGGLHWNEEVREFSHSIARDCDDAFNSTFLSPESCLRDAPNEDPISADATQVSIVSATSMPAPRAKNNTHIDGHPWDRRPLPPTPPTTASVMHELAETKEKIRGIIENREILAYTNRGRSQPNGVARERDSMLGDELSRRIVSAPIYSQYSTQWGKDKIPLPSINEKSKEETRNDASDNYRIVSAPAGCAKAGSVQMDDHTSLEFLSRHDNTIRIVNSPSTKPLTKYTAPEASNLKHVSRGVSAYSVSKKGLNLRQRYMNDEPGSSSADAQESLSADITSSNPTKKKLSWFKRAPKDKEDVLFNPKTGPPSSRTDGFIYSSTNSSEDLIPPVKKKSFNVAFWRNRPENSDAPGPKPARMYSKPAQPPPNDLNLKEVALAIEIMTAIEHGKRSQLCIARFTQEHGAASSFHKVVDTMNSVFRDRNLLVVEKRKMKMMIKTLNS